MFARPLPFLPRAAAAIPKHSAPQQNPAAPRSPRQIPRWLPAAFLLHEARVPSSNGLEDFLDRCATRRAARVRLARGAAAAREARQDAGVAGSHPAQVTR